MSITPALLPPAARRKGRLAWVEYAFPIVLPILALAAALLLGAILLVALGVNPLEA